MHQPVVLMCRCQSDLTSLASARMLSGEDLSSIRTHQALRDHGAAELLHHDIQGANGTVAFGLTYMASLAHIKPQTILLHAWPRYLEELTASRVPIMQVRVHVLMQSG